MKELILLGAGASVEAEVPAAYKMTEKLVELFSVPKSLIDDNAHYSHVLRFVIGGLLMEKGAKNENPFEGVNVEDVFNAIDLLANRENLEAAPFIGSWHPLVHSLDMIHPTLSHLIGERIGNIIPSVTPYGPVPAGGQIYENTKERMIQELVNMVWVEDSSRVEYLKPLLRFFAGGEGVVATLNYDNTVELAGKSAGIDVDTGISEWSKLGAFPAKQNSIYLLKLHGSIDWSLKEVAPAPERPLSSQIISQLPADLIKEKGFRPAVIFGQRNKLTAKGPFLDLLELFKEKLNESGRLTVIGYSFRDEHVNEHVRQWLNKDPNRRVRIINGEEFDMTNSEFTKELGAVQGRIEILKLGAKDGISECFANTNSAFKNNKW